MSVLDAGGSGIDLIDDPDEPTTCPRCGCIHAEGFPIFTVNPMQWWCLCCDKPFDRST